MSMGYLRATYYRAGMIEKKMQRLDTVMTSYNNYWWWFWL
jgi:hypothetical protein